MKSFVQLNRELAEGKKTSDRPVTPSPESHAVSKRAAKIRGSEYNENDPLQAVSGAHMHRALSDHYRKTGQYLDPSIPSHLAKLAHYSRVAWAHSVSHMDAAGQAKEKEFTNGYKISRRKNADLALASHKAGRNSVVDLYNHLRKNGVGHDEAAQYSGHPDPHTGHKGYDSEHGAAYAQAFNSGRGYPNKLHGPVRK